MDKFTQSITGDLSRDFLIDVGLGKVQGYSQAAVVMRNPSADNTQFTDVWAGGGNMSLASAPETWEIVSDNVNDTDGGTGARTVLISSLDSDYNIQPPQIVTLNGTTPVTLSGTHFRPHNLAATSTLFCLTAGSNETNVGTLTLRVLGGGDTRAVVRPGVGKNEDGQVTVPAGKTIMGLQVIRNLPINESADFFVSIKPFGANTARISSGELSSYQNETDLVFQAKFITTEKTDFAWRVKPTNSGASCAVIQEFLIVDN